MEADLWMCHAATSIKDDRITFDEKPRFFRLNQRLGMFMNFSELTESTILAFAKTNGRLHLGFGLEFVSNWLKESKVMAEHIASREILTANYGKDGDAMRQSFCDRLNSLRVKFVFGQGPTIIPGSLLEAMWLQFAKWMMDEFTLKRCGSCQQWFAKEKYNQKFCRARCRRQALFDCKDDVVKMANEGKSPKEISRTLGKDVAIVRKWIKDQNR